MKKDMRPEFHVCDPRYPGRTLAAPKPKKVKPKRRGK